MEEFRIKIETPKLLFDLLKEKLPESEVPVVKNVLGASVIERNESVLEELNSLNSILDEYRQRIAELEVQVCNRNNRSAQLPPRLALPEPPGQRELLKNQIAFFLENFTRAAQKTGVRVEQVLPSSVVKEKEILKYASDQQSTSLPTFPASSSSSTDPSGPSRPASRAGLGRPSSARPQSARRPPSSSPRSSQALSSTRSLNSVNEFSSQNADFSQNLAHQPPSRPTSSLSRPSTSSGRPSTATSTISSTSSLSECEADAAALLEEESVRPYLNAFDIDCVNEALRAELDREHSVLLEEVDWVNLCLEEEMRYESELLQLSLKPQSSSQVDIEPAEPTLAQLREVKSTLENSWTQHERFEAVAQRVKTPVSELASSFSFPRKAPVHLQPLDASASVLRPHANLSSSKIIGSSFPSSSLPALISPTTRAALPNPVSLASAPQNSFPLNLESNESENSSESVISDSSSHIKQVISINSSAPVSSLSEPEDDLATMLAEFCSDRPSTARSKPKLSSKLILGSVSECAPNSISQVPKIIVDSTTTPLNSTPTSNFSSRPSSARVQISAQNLSASHKQTLVEPQSHRPTTLSSASSLSSSIAFASNSLTKLSQSGSKSVSTLNDEEKILSNHSLSQSAPMSRVRQRWLEAQTFGSD